MQASFSGRFANLYRLSALTLCCGISIAGVVQASAGQYPHWDARSDFSSTKNPNGDWDYGYAPSMGSYFQFMPKHMTGNEFAVWNVGPDSAQIKYLGKSSPEFAARMSWMSHGLNLHVGHNGQAAFLRYTIPSAGKYDFKASFESDNLTADTRCRVAVDGFIVKAVDWNPKRYTLDYPESDFSAHSEKFYAGETVDFIVGGKYASGNDVDLSVSVIKKPG